MSSLIPCNISWKLGCISLCSAVILGAIGGHKVPQDKISMFKTANQYHFYSGFAILFCSIKQARLITPLFLFGSLMFSGVSYYRSLTDCKKFNFLMPYGGTLLILGFLGLAIY